MSQQFDRVVGGAGGQRGRGLDGRPGSTELLAVLHERPVCQSRCMHRGQSFEIYSSNLPAVCYRSKDAVNGLSCCAECCKLGNGDAAQRKAKRVGPLPRGLGCAEPIEAGPPHAGGGVDQFQAE